MNQTHAEQPRKVQQNIIIEPFSTDSNGEYTITVNIESIASTPELRDKLQVCYDEGAAGHFSIQSNEDARQIVFTRSFSDDFEMLEERINKGEPIHAAARNQLADEIENAQFGPDCLTSVIMALRDPTNGVVVGLAERRKLPERESRNDNGHFFESDEMVALRWKQYMDNRVETVIYPAPKKHVAYEATYIVAPASDPDWWLGSFSTKGFAESFCKKNYLPYSLCDEQPRRLLAVSKGPGM